MKLISRILFGPTSQPRGSVSVSQAIRILDV